MKLHLILAASAAATVGVAASSAMATPVTLTGNYLEVGISDYGTFGSDGSTEPGILHDPTGTGNFYPGGVPNDYLTPGNPHDGFAINSTQTGLMVNDNNGASAFGMASPMQTGPTSATWSSSSGGIGITNVYSFGVNNEQIQVSTTITNNTGAALTGLYFGRSEDPDPDVDTYGDYETVNTRGDATTSTADLVSGAGSHTGLTIGILNTSTLFPSNTSISYECCENSDPIAVFNGTDDADYSANYPTTDDGDYGLQMAWSLGDLANGMSDTVTYDYVFGTNQSTVSAPTGGVPEPATWAMLLLGFFGLGAMLRSHRKAASGASFA